MNHLLLSEDGKDEFNSLSLCTCQGSQSLICVVAATIHVCSAILVWRPLRKHEQYARMMTICLASFSAQSGNLCFDNKIK